MTLSASWGEFASMSSVRKSSGWMRPLRPALPARVDQVVQTADRLAEPCLARSV
ncbi:hypothetical protein [Streptomyces sp. NPDC048385]|uniref:hypothetical protein n=1 Tax=unclassified Streptomyces TaxID=2593676 RepID=UPI00344A3C90